MSYKPEMMSCITQYETRMYLDTASWEWLEVHALAPLRDAGFNVRPDKSRACLRFTFPVFEGNVPHVLDGTVSGFTGTWALPRLLKLVPPTATRPCTQVVLCVTLAGTRTTANIVLGCLRDPPPASALPDTHAAFSSHGLWFDVILAASSSSTPPVDTDRRIRPKLDLSRDCAGEVGTVTVGHPHPRREMVL